MSNPWEAPARNPWEATKPEHVTPFPEADDATKEILTDEEIGREKVRHHFTQTTNQEYDDPTLDAVLEDNYGTNAVQPALADVEGWYEHPQTKRYKDNPSAKNATLNILGLQTLAHDDLEAPEEIRELDDSEWFLRKSQDWWNRVKESFAGVIAPDTMSQEEFAKLSPEERAERKKMQQVGVVGKAENDLFNKAIFMGTTGKAATAVRANWLDQLRGDERDMTVHETAQYALESGLIQPSEEWSKRFFTETIPSLVLDMPLFMGISALTRGIGILAGMNALGQMLDHVNTGAEFEPEEVKHAFVLDALLKFLPAVGLKFKGSSGVKQRAYQQTGKGVSEKVVETFGGGSPVKAVAGELGNVGIAATAFTAIGTAEQWANNQDIDWKSIPAVFLDNYALIAVMHGAQIKKGFKAKPEQASSYSEKQTAAMKDYWQANEKEIKRQIRKAKKGDEAAQEYVRNIIAHGLAVAEQVNKPGWKPEPVRPAVAAQPAVPKTEQPYTLATVKEVRRGNSDAQIEQIVNKLDPSVQPAALQAFVRPNEQTTAELNLAIERLAEHRQKMRHGRPVEARPEGPEPVTETGEATGGTDTRTSGRLDEIGQHRIGDIVEDPVHGSMELRAQTFRAGGFVTELWVHDTGSVYVEKNDATGETFENAGDSAAVTFLATERAVEPKPAAEPATEPAVETTGTIADMKESDIAAKVEQVGGTAFGKDGWGNWFFNDDKFSGSGIILDPKLTFEENHLRALKGIALDRILPGTGKPKYNEAEKQEIRDLIAKYEGRTEQPESQNPVVVRDLFENLPKRLSDLVWDYDIPPQGNVTAPTVDLALTEAISELGKAQGMKGQDKADIVEALQEAARKLQIRPVSPDQAQTTPSAEIVPEEAPATETDEIEPDLSMYNGLNLTDLADYLADNIARGFPVTDKMLDAALSRFDSQSEAEAFFQTVRIRAAGKKAEIQKAKADPAVQIDPQLLNRNNLLIDENAIRMIDAAAELFDQALWELEYKLMPGNEYYKNDKDVVAYAKASGISIEDHLRSKGPEKRRNRVQHLREAFGPAVFTGDVDMVEHIAAKEKLNLSGKTVQAMKTAARRVASANKINDRALAKQRKPNNYYGIPGLHVPDKGDMGNVAEQQASYRVRVHPNSNVDLSVLSDTMGEAVTATSLAFLKKNSNYEAAKRGGDQSSAHALVQDFDAKVNYKAIKASGAEVILIADTFEGTSKNAIPYAMGALIAHKTGLELVASAVVSKEQGLTGRDFKGRIESDHRYKVEVAVQGKKVLIVDDTYTSGKTILALTKAVQDAGGIPVMVHTLAASQAGKGLKPTEKQVTKLLETLGIDNEQFTEKYGFPATSLTGAQIRRLVDLNSSKDKADIIREQLGSLSRLSQQRYQDSGGQSVNDALANYGTHAPDSTIHDQFAGNVGEALQAGAKAAGAQSQGYVRESPVEYNTSSLGFYSPIRVAVAGMDWKQKPPKDIISQIKNLPKQEEVADLGLYAWLESIEAKKVSRQDVLDFIDNGGAKLVEHLYTEDVNEERIGPPQWLQHQMPGKKSNSINLVLGVPPQAPSALDSWVITRKSSTIKTMDDVVVTDSTTGDEVISAMYLTDHSDEKILQMVANTVLKSSVKVFKNDHYPHEVNQLAELRGNDRTVNGYESFHIEEIQSDMKQRQAKLEKRQKKGNLPPSESKEIEWLRTFPYKDSQSTYRLMFKRIVRRAMDKGKDAVTWTTGKTQALRWQSALRQEVDSVAWNPAGADPTPQKMRELVNRRELVQEVLDIKTKAYERDFDQIEAMHKLDSELTQKMIPLEAEMRAHIQSDDMDTLAAGYPRAAEYETLKTDRWDLRQRLREMEMDRLNRIDELKKQLSRFDQEIRRLESEKAKATLPTVTIELKNGESDLVVDYEPKTGKIISANKYQEKLVDSSDPKTLGDLVGKVLAKRILNEESGYIYDEGIVIGAKGYEDIYDEMLRKIATKEYGKLGAKVELVDLQLTDQAKGDVEPVWQMVFTDKMREKVAQGQAVYEQAGEYLKSRNVNATPHQVRELQQMLDLMASPQEAPIHQQFPHERKDLGLESEVITPQERKELATSVFSILRDSRRRDVTMTKEEIDTVNRALDMGIPITATITEFFRGDPFIWPVGSMTINGPHDVHAASMLSRSPYVEVFKALYLDKNGKVLHAQILSVGTQTSSLVHPRKLFKHMPEGTHGIILSHNHPSGNPAPSENADVPVTKSLIKAAEIMGVKIIDHVITNGQTLFSMRQNSVVRFDDTESKYGKVIHDDKTYNAMDKYLSKQEMAEWEAIRRDNLIPVTTPQQLASAGAVLRQANPNAAFVFVLNVQNKIEAVMQFDISEFGSENANELVRKVIKEGMGTSVILNLPATDSMDAVNISKKTMAAFSELGIETLDTVIHDSSQPGGFISLRESGIMSFAQKSSGASSGLSEAAAEYNTPLVQEIKDRAGELENAMLERLGAAKLDALTETEMALAMRYVAAKQNYDESLEPVDEALLPEAFRKFLEEGWITSAEQIGEDLMAMNEALGTDFKMIRGFYFPLRHAVDEQVDIDTVENIIFSTAGLEAHRRGSFDGVILNPAEQVKLHTRDAALRLTLGRMIAEQRDVVAANQEQIKAALHPDSPAVGIEDPLGLSPEAALVEFNKLRELEREGEKMGFPKGELGNFWLYRNLAMLDKDGGGEEVGTFAVAVDPPFVVQRMDSMAYGKKDEDGRMYGANSYILGEHFTAVRLQRDHLLSTLNEQRRMIKEHNTEGSLRQLNLRMHSLFFDDRHMAGQVFRAKSVDELRQRVPHMREGDYDLAFWYASQIKASIERRLKSADMRSDMSHISSDRHIKFRMLERKVQNGEATEQEARKYLSYAPVHKQDGATEGKGYTTHMILRNFSRWVFERHAIDSKDFFGYFDSVISTTAKNDYLGPIYKRTIAWADALEARGQTKNANWWRLRANKSLKGDMFNWENKLLDAMGNLTKKATGDGENLKGTGSGWEALQNASADDIKSRIVEAAGIMQRARIYNWLVGNYGWMLATQPSSLSNTIKGGFTPLMKAYARIWTGDADITESDVSMIKNKRRGMEGLESISNHESMSVRHGVRSKVRIAATFLQDHLEAHLSHVSYLAGYIAAKEKIGMTEDDARLHGEFIAATTQSMYDRATRNMALNSSLLRVWKPMQTFAFTQMGQILDSLGAVGIRRSRITRLREFLRWRMAAMLWSALWSVFFGDDIWKAIMNPSHNKASVGSHVPVAGKDIDRQINKLPWRTNQYWNKSAPEQFLDETSDVLKVLGNDDEHARRELFLYANQYILPFMGIAGGSMTRNLTNLTSAKMNKGRLEKVNGDLYKKLDVDNPMSWVMGAMFGTKAVDEPESLAEQMGK